MIKYSPYIKIANMLLQNGIVRESYKIYKKQDSNDDKEKKL
jgi:hypothetical protein